MAGLPGCVKQVFVVSADIPAVKHVMVQAALQRFVDNSISKTINLPAGSTADDVCRVSFYARRSKPFDAFALISSHSHFVADLHARVGNGVQGHHDLHRRESQGGRLGDGFHRCGSVSFSFFALIVFSKKQPPPDRRRRRLRQRRRNSSRHRRRRNPFRRRPKRFGLRRSTRSRWTSFSPKMRLPRHRPSIKIVRLRRLSK